MKEEKEGINKEKKKEIVEFKVYLEIIMINFKNVTFIYLFIISDILSNLFFTKFILFNSHIVKVIPKCKYLY